MKKRTITYIIVILIMLVIAIGVFITKNIMKMLKN